MYDVVSLGELLIDFTPAGISENGNTLFECNAGGAPANVAAALAKLGKKSAFIGKVGNDQFGLFLMEVLKSLNVDISGLTFSKDVNTTLAFVHLDEKGDRSFNFYRNPGADMMLEEKEVNYNLIKNSKIFHFGSISMTHEPARTATIKSVKYAKENGLLISFDPNLRPPLWKELNDAKKMIQVGLNFADILKISEEELLFLTNMEDLTEGSKMLFEQYNIQLIFITLGVKGCFYRFGSNIGHVSAYDVNAIDTTGAGDAFMGGILYQIIEKEKKLDDYTVDDVEKIIDFANAAGALATTKRGAIPALPSLEEIHELLKNN
ncbi:PfkB domain protein [Thermoanaerobacter italicus Ab9]|uniref:PfkB domain protein n=1 Tax=Thermoanaerobacter italicus (strain DSM 9252 / Ab9) TaxID=580331 RepID=D3T535_THEIA|nr:PfkB family carbohydrate kinase [Thermoanaerobacter italicus]ADD03328.1 PfkB domain protein [Thermoanaerobacter italicus Ab9]